MFKLGKDKYQENKYFEAIDLLDQAISRDSAFVNAIYYRGLSFQKIDQHKLAIPDFTFVIDNLTTLDREVAVYFLHRAVSFSKIRDISSAEEDFTMALKLKPDYHEAYCELARHYFTFLNDKNKAISALDHAIQYAPENSQYYVLRAEYKAYQARFRINNKDLYESAVRDVTFAIDFDPGNFDYYLLRSQYNRERGEPEEAILDYNQMIRLEPDRVEGYIERGIVKMQGDQYMSAIEDFTRSIELSPAQEKCYRYRALCKYNVLDYSGAFQDYSISIDLQTKAYKEAPNDKEIRRLLADTYIKRGASTVMQGNTYNACSDFRSAYQLGSRIGYNYLRKYCGI